MKFTGLLWCMLLLSVWTLSAQSPTIESLKKEIASLEGEAYYAKTNDLVKAYLDYDAAKALHMIDSSINSAGIGQYKTQLARAKYLRGVSYAFLRDYRAAIKSYDEATKLSEALENAELLAKNHVGNAAVHSLLGEYDKATELFKSGIRIAEDLENTSILAEAYFRFGRYQFHIDQKGDAFDFYERSLAIYNDLEDKKASSDVMYWMAVLFDNQKEEEKALEYYFKSRAIKEEIQDIRGLSNSGLSLGALHWEKGNYSTAMEFYNQSLEGYQALGDISSMARVYNNIGLVYEDWKKLDSALIYYEKSSELHDQLNSNIGRIRSALNIGETYKLKNDYKKSKSYILKAKFHSENSKENYSLAFIYDKLAEIYLLENQLDSSEVYLNKSLVRNREDDEYFGLWRTYLNLSNLEKKRGNYKKALEYFEMHKEILDSLSKTEKAKELAEIQGKYDNEKKEREIVSLQRENEKSEFWRNILTVGLILAAISSFLLFRFFKFRNRKNAELLEVKEKQRQQLEDTDKMKTRFFNNISHEFRTPLTLIMGPLQHLEDQVEVKLQPTIKTIERNAQRLLKLINQLLDLSKIDAGRLGLKIQHTDIVPLLKGWITSFHSMTEMKGVALDFDFAEGHYFLYLDHTKLEEIVVNLLSNAIKHTTKGGKVVIQIEEEHIDGLDYAKLIVSDTGSGIPKQELDHIFDRFYQVSNSNATDQVGTGIGLSLVKELVELHHGKIEVSSEEGEGSEFTVYLPKGKSHFSSEEVVAMSPVIAIPMEKIEVSGDYVAQHDESEEQSRPILLLVEDNADLRQYIKNFLSASYKIEEAEDGQQGVDMAIDLLPDIIVSDLMMPKLDGLELSKLLKEDVRTSHIPIVLLTARASIEDKIEGLRNQADDYIVKPFNNEELMVRLDNLIALRRKIQDQYKTESILLPKKIQLNSVDQNFMEKVTEILEVEISNPLFGVDELSKAVLMSRSRLFRKMKAITNLTPNIFIRNFRLHRAMDMLQQKTATIGEIAYEVGFQNPSYFSKCFQEHFGKLPSEVIAAQ